MQAVCENRSLIPYGNSVTVLRADTNESKGHRKNEKIDTTDIKVRRSRISLLFYRLRHHGGSHGALRHTVGNFQRNLLFSIGNCKLYSEHYHGI